jgi:hypothetical protein
MEVLPGDCLVKDLAQLGFGRHRVHVAQRTRQHAGVLQTAVGATGGLGDPTQRGQRGVHAAR